MTKLIKLKFYSDAGHGWLAVKRSLLESLNLSEKISQYSYQRGKTVYLEEDRDAGILIEALDNAKVDHGIIYKYGRNGQWPERSPIRSYDRYKN